MTADRKREAREKFLLGGIVVRAGLTGADRAFLLGGFLEMARIAPGSAKYRRMRDIGEKAFRMATEDDGSSAHHGRITEAAE